MELTKLTQQELAAELKSISSELRGVFDSWDFKNYVLGGLFFKFLSEKIIKHVAVTYRINFIDFPDKDAENLKSSIVAKIGYFIPPSELFINVYRQDQISIIMSNVFQHIEDSVQGTEFEDRFSGIFNDCDPLSNKIGVDIATRNLRISKLLKAISSIKVDFNAIDSDILGDAYEVLISMYAENAGRSGGEFFTPIEVSELLTQLGIVNMSIPKSVYDPSCGSGSLLLSSIKVIKEKIQNNATLPPIDFYGQEINPMTYNLCRMNMILHNIDLDRFHIACGNTLSDPKFWDNKFDLIVSNPPYSVHWAGDSDPAMLTDPRFAPVGVLAPKSKGDFAFVLHCLYHLAKTGTAAIVCFPGILYRIKSEQKIRKYLIDNNFVDAVIQLPENLFFGTSITTCILILKKNRSSKNILFMDASNECNKLTHKFVLEKKHINKIVDSYAYWRNQEHFSRIVSISKVIEQDFNLSVNTYVQKPNALETLDINALNTEIDLIVNREQQLRDEIERIINGL